MSSPLIRVQKIVAETLRVSRREADRWLKEGLITINGQKAKPGDLADPQEDSIKVRGKLLHIRESTPETILLNKPKGCLCQLRDDISGRRTLKNVHPELNGRWVFLAPLDFNADGVILATTDLKFAARLKSLRELPEVFEAKIKGAPGPETLRRLTKGVVLKTPGEKTRRLFVEAARPKSRLANKSVIEFWCHGLSSRDLRELFKLTGFLVERLTRIRIGHLDRQSIERGKFRRLTGSGLETLFDQPKLGITQFT